MIGTIFVGSSCSQISHQSNYTDDSHNGTVFAASNSQTNRRNSSQASSQSNDIDNSHRERIISDDGIELVDRSSHNIESKDINPHNLMVGSVIEYECDEPAQCTCGEIKWIGELPDQEEVYAGVEMVKHGSSACTQSLSV